jgi:hypothetical protein
VIKQLWEQGKDDAYIAERVFQHASFAAFVFRRRHQRGWIHTREGK